jgi:hypothetical protein
LCWLLIVCVGGSLNYSIVCAHLCLQDKFTEELEQKVDLNQVRNKNLTNKEELAPPYIHPSANTATLTTFLFSLSLFSLCVTGRGLVYCIFGRA